jgi:hypothetical protein
MSVKLKMSVETQFYQLENRIITYLCENFFRLYEGKSKDEKRAALDEWFQYLDKSTEGEQFSEWLLQKFQLSDFEEVCQHILECRVDKIYLDEPIPESCRNILDMYARYYVNISLTAQSLSDSLNY